MAKSDNKTTQAGGSPEVTSIRALAREVGRAESTVRKWKKREDWPFGNRGPWSVKLVSQWMDLHLDREDHAHRYHDAQKGKGPKPLSELESARKDGYIEAAAIRRLKRLQMEGQLHDVEECRARRRRQVFSVRNALLRLPRSIAPDLVGRGRRDIERILKDRMTSICESFARGDDDEG